jgi:hypothetical protein
LRVEMDVAVDKQRDRLSKEVDAVGQVVRRWAREECGSQAKTNVLANAIVTCGVVIVSVDGWELRADAKRGSRPSGRLTHVLLK